MGGVRRAGAREGPRGIGEILVSSRPYDEFLALFGLAERVVLAGPVLDCPGGAGPFGAAVRARGGRAVSADPAYALPPAEIVAQVRAGLEHGIRYLGENEESYVWTFFSSLDDLRRRRGAALEEFARDFRGPDPRYVVAALPRLPFDDGAFRLVLSAYLLFAYPDHLDEEGQSVPCASCSAWRARRCASSRSSTRPTSATRRSTSCAGASPPTGSTARCGAWTTSSSAGATRCWCCDPQSRR